MKKTLLLAIASGFLLSCTAQDNTEYPYQLTEQEWKAQLTEQEYRILRQKGTEPSFSGDLLKNKEKGIYTCAGCGEDLFHSSTKFKSGTGWPSFYSFIAEDVKELPDTSYGWQRTEVVCANCGGHLGHVFKDGPAPTGLRYCINSVSLDFKKTP